MSGRSPERRRPGYRLLLEGFALSRGLVAIAVVAVLVQAVANVAVPVAVRHGIDRGIVAGDRGVAFAMAGLAAVLGVLQSAGGVHELRCATSAGERFLSVLRRRLLAKLHALDLGTLDLLGAGTVHTRLTSDVDAVQPFLLTGAGLFVRSATLLTFTAVSMVVLEARLAAASLAVVVPFVIEQAWFRRRSFAAQLVVRDAAAVVVGESAESFAGAHVVRAYGLEDRQRVRFRAATDGFQEAKRGVVWVSARHLAFLEFAQPALLGVVVAFGCLLVARGETTVGVVVAATLYATRIFQPIQQMAELSETVQAASAALARVHGFLQAGGVVADAPDARPLVPGAGEVRLRDLHYVYPGGAHALRGVDLRVRPGERVALVGPSGAGKSTLVRLVARLADPTTGVVEIDGQDVRTVTARSLHEHVALVPQHDYLFTGTVADNLAMVLPNGDRTELEARLRSIGLDRLLAALPHGLATPVDDRGANLSAGQRQLVGLARVALGNARVLLLDEVTGRMDPDTAEAIEELLQVALADRTVLIVTHRDGTARRAERVVRLEDGRVVADSPEYMPA